MKFTDNEIRDIARYLEEGKPLPEKYRFLLFEEKREVELVWNGKTNEVCNVVLPFQVIEQVDEPRSEKDLKLQAELFDMQTGRQIKGWNNKLIWGDNKLILSSLKNGLPREEIEAQVKDRKFILFLEKIINEKQISFSFDEIYELEKIRENQPVFRVENRDKFLGTGVIEQVGKTRGAKYILSHAYYKHEGKVGEHTRLTPLARSKYKELILSHLKKNKGFRQDLQDAFQELQPQDISNILQELKRENKIMFLGSRRSGYWKLAN